jgi:hypothetical protein
MRLPNSLNVTNPFSRAMALGLTQPLTEMSTRKCFCGAERGQRVRLTSSPPSVSRISLFLCVFNTHFYDNRKIKRINSCYDGTPRHRDWLRAGRPRDWSLSPCKVNVHVMQTASGAHPVSYPKGTGGSLPWDKVAGV